MSKGTRTREQSTEHARLFFSGHGFRVEDIPEEQSVKRADLRLWFKDEEYVLEAKFREPEGRWRELMKQVEQGGYGFVSREIEPWNALSSMITEAHDQLCATPAGQGAFRVLWATALHEDDEFVVACLEKRLLGSVELAIKTPENIAKFMTSMCYFHSGNDFARCQNMDAAVLGGRAGLNLFVNSFSERRGAFRQSELYRMVATQNAVVDPELEVERGQAFMLGSDFLGPRGPGGGPQWEYLRNRYGILASVMQERQFAGLMSIPREAFEREPQD